MNRSVSGVTIAAVALALAACASPPARVPAPATPARLIQAPASISVAPARSADERFKAALALLKNQQRAEAQAAFVALSRDFPEYSGPLTDLGILYARGRQPAQALASFGAAVEKNPANAVALNWLGILHREAGDYAGAEQCYRKALAARPDYAAAHLNLGILYEVAMRRPQEALAQYREYQKYAGDQNLIVTAWIRELEAAAPQKTAVASGTAP